MSGYLSCIIMELEDLFLQFIDSYQNVLLNINREAEGDTGYPNITLNQFFYLQCIQRNENTTLTELAQKLNVSKPSAAVIVSKLIEEGFVIRTRSTVDRRKFHLILSEKGHQVFLIKKKAYFKIIDNIIENTTEKQQKILIEAFKIMITCSPELESS